jgi:hypothetical protein
VPLEYSNSETDISIKWSCRLPYWDYEDAIKEVSLFGATEMDIVAFAALLNGIDDSVIMTFVYLLRRFMNVPMRFPYVCAWF